MGEIYLSIVSDLQADTMLKYISFDAIFIRYFEFLNIIDTSLNVTTIISSEKENIFDVESNLSSSNGLKRLCQAFNRYYNTNVSLSVSVFSRFITPASP